MCGQHTNRPGDIPLCDCSGLHGKNATAPDSEGQSECERPSIGGLKNVVIEKDYQGPRSEVPLMWCKLLKKWPAAHASRATFARRLHREVCGSYDISVRGKTIEELGANAFGQGSVWVTSRFACCKCGNKQQDMRSKEHGALVDEETTGEHGVLLLDASAV